MTDILVRENAKLEAFYRLQKIVPEGEWETFMGHLRIGLPSTFRVTGHRDTALGIQKHLEEVLIPALPRQGEDGAALPVPQPIPWYPGGLGWNMRSERKAIRTLPEYQDFHQWLKAATENGDISRQEAVSMIPPLLLDVKSDHLVLDMCAAPGSKTAQLVEQMHRECAEGQLPTGMVVANDVDQKRAYLLHHQVKRILSPCLLVTNHDGTLFPNLYTGASGEDAVLFDRILADVPCSGDGTIRKNPGLWRDWSPASGLGLHSLQVRLLDRVLQMTKVGGRVVYSTCSMNPIEDEAVLAALLTKYRGRVRLIDCSDRLPELKRLPGVTSWKVTSRDGSQVYASYEDVSEAERRRIPETCFPRPEYAELGLDRAMRIMPHLQDTGGFFIACLEKVDELSAGAPQQRKRKVPKADAKASSSAEDFIVIPASSNQPLQGILKSFGIYQASLSGGTFVSRTQKADQVKSLSFVSAAVHGLLEPTGLNPGLRIVNMGARAFELYDPSCKRDLPCPYRILSESASLFAACRIIGQDRVVPVAPADLVTLLGSLDSVLFADLPSLPGAVKALPEGSLVFTAAGRSGHPVVVPVWKGDKSVKAYIPRPNRPALLYQLQN